MKAKLLIVALLLCRFSAFAEPITIEQAKQKAKTFLTQPDGRRKVHAQGESMQLTTVMEDPNFYVFNVGTNNGYVIVSGSDRTQAILGYTDTGTINVKNMPDPMKHWLKELSVAVSTIDKGKKQVREKAPKASTSTKKTITKNVVPMLVTTKWNQGNPYNLECPEYKSKNGSKGRCATGCVATAMAQILGYWRIPKTPVPEIPSYKYNYEGTSYTLDALPSVTFDWTNITDTYNSYSSTASKKAISQLMRYVGQSVKMGYGPSSGAGVGHIPPAFVKYFGFDPNLSYETHDSYTYQEWEDLIYSELAAGRPMVMNATTSEGGGGHEFVIDGYDGNGYYHINWGWGGMDDGYFLLTVMSPGQQGIGGSTSADGYSMGQGVVVGLKPAESGATPQKEIVRIDIFNIKLDKTTYTRKYTKAYFMPRIKFAAGTNLQKRYTFDASFALYDTAGNIVRENIGNDWDFSLSPGTYWPERSILAMLDPDIPDGIYHIKGRSREHGTQEWVEDRFFNTNYVIAEIKGTELTLKVFPVLDVNVKSLEIMGNLCVNKECQVKATITNNASDYYKEMYLFEDDKWVSGNGVNLPGGKTTEVFFKYKPKMVGSHTLALSRSKDKKDIFYSTTVNVTAERKGNLSFVTVPQGFEYINGSKYLYGDKVTISVKVMNKDTEPYIGNIKVAPWELAGGFFWMKHTESQFINLKEGKDTTLVYTLKDLNAGSTYFFSVNSENSGDDRCGDFIVKDGIRYWTADGTQHGVKSQNGFTVTKDMVAVAIPGKNTPATLSIGDDYNKNLIIYYEEGANIGHRVLTLLKKKVHNIVFGSEAEKLVLSDDNSLYIPKAFIAKQAVYNHQVGNITNNNGWRTLALPFAPQTITANGRNIDWFRTATDTGKDLLIKEFSAVEGNRLYFDYVTSITANRPYLVAYAGTQNGTAFSLTGQTVTYTAANAAIETVERISTYSTDYKYMGTTATQTLPEAYILNADGKQFIATSPVTVNPFCAYFVANNVDAAKVRSLLVVQETTTGITDINTHRADQPLIIYNLSGNRVAIATDQTLNSVLNILPQGVYIAGGQKYTR